MTRHFHNSRRFLMVAVPTALLGIAIGISLRWSNDGKPPGSAQAAGRSVTPREPFHAQEQATIDLFRSASKSVAFITTSAVARDFNFNVLAIPKGNGSGFVWDSDGHIVTNFHVIEGANRIRVTLADQSAWDAKIVGTTARRDIAILKIAAPADRLHPIQIGTSADLEVGQSVLAIGNPFGLDQTLTTGVISGVGREIRSKSGRKIEDVIQTDAAINPGNSGGPLLDSAGRIIGVNTAIFSPSGAFAGVGFAIPIDEVNRIVPEILQHGRLVRAGLGVRIAPDSVMRRLGASGALIYEVPESSAADKAGLRGLRETAAGELLLGDIIVAIDGKPVKRQNDLLDHLDNNKVDDQVLVELIRDAGTDQQRRIKAQVQLQEVR